MATEGASAIPALPAEWKGDEGSPNFRAVGTLSAPVLRKIEPFGAAFLAHARRKRHGRTFSEDDRIQALAKVKKTEDSDDGGISEPEDPELLSRDAKDWKTQDHYAVLGLSKLRYKATDEDIKKAHRKKVLRHHPDKKAAAGQADTDSFFKMIQRANEILTDPVRRRQFDSVDEEADVAAPEKSDIKKPSHFYRKWGAFFEAEGRFSTLQPVPKFGDENTSKEDLDEFYNFFTNFKDYSWRSFEYLDEDVPDDNADRDHKRHIEKKNRNARSKRKNENIARLSQLVEKAMASDERIKKFRNAKNAEKNKKRIEKEATAKREAEEKQKAKEEADRQQKEADEQAKVSREAAKKDKDAAKNAAKKNRRVLRDSAKNANYFVDGNASASAIDAALDDIERISKAVDVEELADLVAKLNVAGKDGGKLKEAFTQQKSELVKQGKVKDGDFKVFT